MKTLRALIFDVDGTLADTEEVHRLAFNAAFERFGLEWEWPRDLYAELLAVSGGRERLRYYVDAHYPELIEKSDYPDFITRLHQLKTRIYAEMLVDGRVCLRPGVRRLLDETREARIELAIATSTALSNVRTLLDQNLPQGWDTWFSVIATRDSVSEQKPSPAIYSYVLEKLGVAADQAFAVEDTYNGNQAALAANVRTVITTHYFTRHHNFTGASLVVDHLGEPDCPFHVLQGNAHGAHEVDLALLRRLLRDPLSKETKAAHRAPALAAVATG